MHLAIVPSLVKSLVLLKCQIWPHFLLELSVSISQLHYPLFCENPIIYLYLCSSEDNKVPTFAIKICPLDTSRPIITLRRILYSYKRDIPIQWPSEYRMFLIKCPDYMDNNTHLVKNKLSMKSLSHIRRVWQTLLLVDVAALVHPCIWFLCLCGTGHGQVCSSLLW